MNKDQLLERAFSLCDEIEQRQSQLRDILCLLMSAEPSSEFQQKSYVTESTPADDVETLSQLTDEVTDSHSSIIEEMVENSPIEKQKEYVASFVSYTQESITSEIVTESAPLHKPKTNKVDLRKALTINDRFRFRRELFAGDEQAMTTLLERLSECSSSTEACAVISSLGWDMDSEAVNEFLEFIRNNFNTHR